MSHSGYICCRNQAAESFQETHRTFAEGRMRTNEMLSKGSRRTFLQLSAAATAAMAFRIATEASLAAEERNIYHPGAVVIDANENPLGPCEAARKAIVDMAPQGGRYSYWLKEEFVKTFTRRKFPEPALSKLRLRKRMRTISRPCSPPRRMPGSSMSARRTIRPER